MDTPTSSLLLILIAAATATASSFVASHATSSTCVPQETAALLAFKQAITGDPAGRLASWHQGQQDCCRWSGVRCSNRTSSSHVVVVGLNLRNTGDGGPYYEDTALVGQQISPSLLSLNHLEHLDLSMNSISGGVPEFLGLLKNLRYLNLSGMPLSGRVPPQPSNLSNLHSLDLSSNAYQLGSPNLYSTDISWLSNLPLRYLKMDSVNLSRIVDWAQAVNTIPSLKVLRLPCCSLISANQSLPYLNLTQLEELSLSANFFDQPVASCWFWNLTTLRYLDLSSTQLYGQIPGTLGGMTSLQVLDMSNLRGISMMTANMTNLHNLEIIDLSGNSIDGNITELLAQGSPNKLRELHLEYNNLSGVLPNWIGRWTSLLILDLTYNNIIGHVPSETGQLNNLLALNLGNNQFTGPVPSEIFMLGNLSDMDLSNNNLSGVITHEQLGGLKRLRYIDLSGNSFKIVVDQEWLPPFRLENAYFASCQMGPLFPTWLQSQTHIRELNITGASIFDRLPAWFLTTFSNAWILDISNNWISGTLPTSLKNMTSLEGLYLNSNQLSGPIPELPISLSLFVISDNSLTGALPSNVGTENLEYLNIASNHIGGPIPQSICQLNTNLMHLNLANNHFDGKFPSCFGPKGLTTLILHNNTLSGEFPSFLKSSTHLRILDLAWNNFSERIPTWIGDLSELSILQLSHNMFTGSIPSTITRLHNLVQLNLAGNSISGLLPCHLSNWTGMTKEGAFRSMLTGPLIMHAYGYIPLVVDLPVITKGQERYYNNDEFYEMVTIDLSSNQLTGRIPEGIASLDRVINLNLSRNQLSGKIPNKIGAMQSLESLDLSENKIHGEIPQSLTNITYLSYLDLSFNNLKGRIPSGGQLDTLYAEWPSMYNGNNGLCGLPLQKNCTSNKEPKHGDHEGDEYDSMVLSFSFGLGVGYVIGLWVVFCVMLFKNPWRIAFFCLFDKVSGFVSVIWARWAKKEATH